MKKAKKPKLVNGTGDEGRISAEDTYYQMPARKDGVSQGADPVKFLFAFASMRAHPNWRTIGFDHEGLEWLANVWAEAAAASMNDDLIVHERDRYLKLCKDLKDGEWARQEGGVTFLSEESDWPHPLTIWKAIHALQHAEIKRVQ